jgi:hypothetical protein
MQDLEIVAVMFVIIFIPLLALALYIKSETMIMGIAKDNDGSWRYFNRRGIIKDKEVL